MALDDEDKALVDDLIAKGFTGDQIRRVALPRISARRASPGLPSSPTDRPAGLPGTVDLDAKIARGLTPVPGKTPEETLALAKSDRIAPTVSKLASAGMGAVQGASFGFGDEIAAAATSALGHLGLGEKKTYRQARNEYQQSLDYAQEANPKSYLAGEVVGSVAGPALAGKAAGIGARTLGAATSAARAAPTIGRLAAEGAATGGLYGLGESRADLTSDDDSEWAKALGSTAIGVGTGGALGYGLGRIARGAKERVVNRAIAETTQGEESVANKRWSRKVGAAVGPENAVAQKVIEENPKVGYALSVQAATKPKKAAEVVRSALDGFWDQTERFYAGERARPAELKRRFDNLMQDMADSGQAVMHDAAETVRDRAVKLWGDGQQPTIKLRSLRNFANEVGDIAFAKDRMVATSVKERAMKEMYGAILSTIEDEVSAAGKPVDALKAINKQIAFLAPTKKALEERAELEAAKRMSGRNILSQAVLTAVGAGAGLAKGSLVDAAVGAAALQGARLGYKHIAKPLARRLDYGIARMVSAANKGATLPSLITLGVESGVPRAAAETLAARLGRGNPEPDEPDPTAQP